MQNMNRRERIMLAAAVIQAAGALVYLGQVAGWW